MRVVVSEFLSLQGFAQVWPSRTDDVGFADKMNSMATLVVSTTLRDAIALQLVNSKMVGARVLTVIYEPAGKEGGAVGR